MWARTLLCLLLFCHIHCHYMRDKEDYHHMTSDAKGILFRVFQKLQQNHPDLRNIKSLPKKISILKTRLHQHLKRKINTDFVKKQL
ncbi:hypothetical protein KGM_210266 [Danaus plexippus plexippus]|uniref:Uncharacterized protein n=1 Tax=Danaus plexippus plexippus TaxID=278856 RepID=A0A212F3S8_DANPL|nr:hypothetical protein KGM_210266 [Danaus plexippus plexippus]